MAHHGQAQLCAWCGNCGSACTVDVTAHGTPNADPCTVRCTSRHGSRGRVTDVLVDRCHYRLHDQSGGTVTHRRVGSCPVGWADGDLIKAADDLEATVFLRNAPPSRLFWAGRLARLRR